MKISKDNEKLFDGDVLIVVSTGSSPAEIDCQGYPFVREAVFAREGYRVELSAIEMHRLLDRIPTDVLKLWIPKEED